MNTTVKNSRKRVSVTTEKVNDKNTKLIENFDTIDSVNFNMTIVKKERTKKVDSKKSATAQKLDSLNYEASSKIAKAVKSLDFLFSSIRSIILSLIANNQKLNVFDKAAIISILRRSKKDTALYVTLRNLSEFTYKAVKKTVNSVTTVNIVKSFSVSSVLKACDVYAQISAVELTDSLITAIKQEHEIAALNKLSTNIDTLHVQCETVSNLIAKLVDTAQAEKVELTDKLDKLQSNLIEKTKMFEYLSLQSNRANIH